MREEVKKVLELLDSEDETNIELGKVLMESQQLKGDVLNCLLSEIKRMVAVKSLVEGDQGKKSSFENCTIYSRVENNEPLFTYNPIMDGSVFPSLKNYLIIPIEKISNTTLDLVQRELSDTTITP